jgi:hypothetical protein
MIRRELNPEVRTLDVKAGIVEYVASDESIDAQREIVRARWMAVRPVREEFAAGGFASSTGASRAQLGKVIDFRVVGRQLVETAQFAIDVPECRLARLAFGMTKDAGYLKAVSVGFTPELIITKVPSEHWGPDWSGAQVLPANSKPGRPLWDSALSDLQVDGKRVDTVYVAQQQIELSACVIGSNPNALAKSYKAGVINDADLEIISEETSKRETTATKAMESDAALVAQASESEGEVPG